MRSRALLVLAALLAQLAACAHAPEGSSRSVVPGTIGASVREAKGGVAVVELRPHGAGERAGLRVGDLLASYNGIPVESLRQFWWLVTESVPGTVATVGVVRGGERMSLQVPVEQLDVMPRG